MRVYIYVLIMRIRIRSYGGIQIGQSSGIDHLADAWDNRCREGWMDTYGHVQAPRRKSGNTRMARTARGGSDSTTEGLLLLMRRVECGCTNNIIKVRKRPGAEAERA